MGQRDPLKVYSLWKRFPTVHAQLSHADKEPYIGVSQGGSSRPNQPAKVAATKAEWKPTEKFLKKLMR